MPAQRFLLAAMACQSGLQIALGAATVDIISGLKDKIAQGADLYLAPPLEIYH